MGVEASLVSETTGRDASVPGSCAAKIGASFNSDRSDGGGSSNRSEGGMAPVDRQRLASRGVVDGAKNNGRVPFSAILDCSLWRRRTN